MLKKWKELGVEDSEQLRKLLVKRSLRPAGIVGGCAGHGTYISRHTAYGQGELGCLAAGGGGWVVAASWG